MNQSKLCHKCEQVKELVEFSKNKRTKDGLQSQCKKCNAAYALANRERISARDKARRLVDGDKMRAQSRASWAKHRDKRLAWHREHYAQNKDKYAEYHKKYYPTVADKKRAVSKKWREDNPERYKQQMRDWLQNNLDKHNENSRKRRAILRNAKTGFVSQKELKHLLSSPCLYCGSTAEITIDHIIPLARGGDHTIGNFAPACKKCNSTKRDSFIMEWRKRESPRK